MSKDDQPNNTSGLKVVSVVGRARKGVPRTWVQAVSGLPTQEVLMETSVMLGCIMALTHQALERPKDAKVLMRATHYMSGMAKAMIDGQLPQQKDDGPAQGH
ncbi:DUF3077 domain-containing protein [Pseudomonas entomophila]|uniref:DUF3077 domain-containing protein n=1 Tax=Pseudomonas entomophila TaxID=312306 RepID=UPI0023D83911|nr:DUF3077 domain-containing protein [Pseudomonas entomophila]MDF0732667.1 DUF3077 domain-containing protein [Pseudomonas entomophila]